MSPLFPEMKVGDCVIPAGHPAEQFMANLMLAVFAFHAGDADIGRKHLSYALSVAAALERQTQPYRSETRLKVVGITSGTDDQSETLMLPVVNEHLVVPGVGIEKIAETLRSSAGGQPTISLQKLEVFHYDLRLRPARIRRSLAEIAELGSTGHLLARTESLLTGCLADRRRNVDAIDAAYDYLSLTYEFASAGNLMLAGMSLRQATGMIDALTADLPELNDMQSVVAFRAKVDVLARELKSRIS